VASIFPSLTVEESLLVAVQSQLGRAGVLGRRFPLPASFDRAGEVMEMLGLLQNAGRLCANLSHGDAKLLDIALALVFRPQVLLLDEPTAGMSLEEVPAIIELIERIRARRDRTILLVEHKIDMVMALSDSVAVLQDGRLIADGPPAAVSASAEVQAAYFGTTPHPTTPHPTLSPEGRG
jgi:branched-chain amino acid transport system ATP-binding protein